MRKSMGRLFRFGVELVFNAPGVTTARARVVKGVLWFITGIGAAAAAARMIRGLGATTNLSDVTPWGLWIGFDVVGGVALAAGGFVIAATVYVFHLHRYHAIVRPAVLTAFLGYGAVIVGLIFDLGVWWNIWRPTVFWQHHSALFEVAWCVMLYFTVLAFEFAPVVLEKLPFPRLFRFFRAMTLPLVILGIMLSTLHQSSLGTLFLIMPFRLHPLWYSTLQPVLFFVSAVALGLAMVTLESLISAWIYRRRNELPLLAGLARAAAVVLGVYTLIRLGDLAADGRLSFLARPSWEAAVFALEMLLCAVIPLVLFSVPATRRSRSGLFLGASLCVLGFVFNRINVSGISTITVTGTGYVPAWTEFAVSLGVVSAAALVFFFFVEHFSVYEDGGDTRRAEIALPARDPVSGTWLGVHRAGDGALYSLIFILAAAIGVYFLPGDAVSGPVPRKTPVGLPRTVSAARHGIDGRVYSALTLAGAGAGEQAGGTIRRVLLLDANRDGRFVLFDHDGHQERNGGRTSCQLCHHLNRPFDQATLCVNCHRDMYLPTDTFDHRRHAARAGGNRGCGSCHPDAGAARTRQAAPPCLSCHREMIARGSRVFLKDDRLERPAPGYMDAMHGLCLNCHRENATRRPELSADFGRCAACHHETDPDYLRRLPLYPAPRPAGTAGFELAGEPGSGAWSGAPAGAEN